MDEQELIEFWRRYCTQPRYIETNPELMKELAERLPGGGNAHQRRVWRRLWTPRKKKKPV